LKSMRFVRQEPIHHNHQTLLEMASFSIAGSIRPVTEVQNTFTDDYAAFLLQKAESGIETLLTNTKDSAVSSDGRPWVQCFNRPDLHLQVFSSEAAGTPLKRFKAVCILHDMSPQEVVHFIADDTYRMSWDKSLKDFTPLLVRDFSDSTSGKLKKLVILRCATKGFGPISARDFVDVTLTATLDDGSIVVAGSSLLPNETCGNFLPNKQFVRGFNLVGSGSHLERCGPNGKDTKVSYVIHTDLKGWFTPMVINNAIGGSHVTYFEELKRALAAAYPDRTARAHA
jgi:START domain